VGQRQPRSSQRRSPVARVTPRTILTVDYPVVTLDRRQSAIGSLVVDLAPAGTLSCVWELTDGTSGIVSDAVAGPNGVRTSPMFGRRPLVELRKGQILVGLRHVAELRRLLIVTAGHPADGSPATTVLSLYKGATIESAHKSAEPCISSLAVYQVDGELVVRREGFGFPDVRAAAEAYGFAATWMPPPTVR
jgi:hypothetical protein